MLKVAIGDEIGKIMKVWFNISEFKEKIMIIGRSDWDTKSRK